MGAKEDKTKKPEAPAKAPLKSRVWREIIGWVWVILAFLLIQSTIVQARVIPSGSMEDTLLIGDHLLVSRFGYDAGVPLTNLHMPLWRNPHRQQVIVFHPPFAGGNDYIKRVVAVPGDRLEIRNGAVWINGRPLDEPYVSNAPADDFAYDFPPADSHSFLPGTTYEWGHAMSAHIRDGKLVVPADHYFVMGDNRGDSYDSRFWGFVPRENIIGTPLFIYMSVDAEKDAWQPGHLQDRVLAYARAVVQPGRVRWKRLFTSP
jgi:signal peptidase I